MKQDNTKWVHVIGICGTTTSGVAYMFRQKGWKVTGSDKGFFPPVSTFLEQSGLEVQPGFKAERLTDEEGRHPDLVVQISYAGENNPEVAEAQRLGLHMIAYPEVMEEFVVKDGGSIVVAGTYGKTTTTALLLAMLEKAQVKVSYMLGAMTSDYRSTVGGLEPDSKFSVIEGDEWQISEFDKRSKFFLYRTKYLILTAMEWDHIDLFPTLASYVDNFRNYLQTLPSDGFIVANANQENIVDVCSSTQRKVIYYSSDKSKALTEPHWYLDRSTKPLPTLVRPEKAEASLEVIPFERQIVGDYNDENILAAAVMAYELGVKKERIQEAVVEFKGVKRRLEKRFENEKVIVIDDLGSTPFKAKGAVTAIRKDFPQSKIIVIFEPNTGNRLEEALPLYRGVFDAVDEVILPRFTKLLASDTLKRFGANRLYETLLEFGVQTSNIRSDSELIAHVVNNVAKTDKHTVVAFLGSHGFRGMIEELVEKLQLE